MDSVNISISEINQYLKCRRAWDYSSNVRQSLRHKATPKMFLTVGSAVHEAIDAQAGGNDPMEALEEYIEKELASRKEAYRDAVGGDPWEVELEDFQEAAQKARDLTRQYFNHYGWGNSLESSGLKYLGSEIPFTLDLGEFHGVRVNLVGTIDGFATDLATESQIHIVENKTAARKLDPDKITFNNQFIGYCWVFRVLTGINPSSILYNVLFKRKIEPPKVLKSGKLSRDKQAPVTYASYLEALQSGGHDVIAYTDHLEFLHNREVQGDDRFFLRETFTYSQLQLDNWGDNLYAILDEMVNPNTFIYPNYNSCDMCFYKDLCHEQEYGEGTTVRDTRYVKGSYGTMEAVKNSSEMQWNHVEDASTLMEFLQKGSNGKENRSG